MGERKASGTKEDYRRRRRFAIVAVASLAFFAGASRAVADLNGDRRVTGAPVADAAPDALSCFTPGSPAPASLRDLADAVELLRGPGEFGEYLRDLLRETGLRVCIDLSTDCRGYYEPEANVLALGHGLATAEMTLILVHELRHLAQSRDGYALSLAVDLTEHVRQTYALEADAQAFATLYAWRSSMMGRGELWRVALGQARFGDIAEAFAAAIGKGEDTSTATRAAFSAWYASPWRRERYFLAAASAYLDRLDETHAIRGYAMLPDGHFDRLCRLPDGSEYGCTGTAEIADRRIGLQVPQGVAAE